MTVRRLAGAVALALAGAGLLLGGSPAQAQDEHFPAAGWEVRQIGIGDLVWSPAAASTILDATTVELTKPDGTTGTSIETTDLGLDVAAGTEVSVSYELEGGATVDAGAIRLFWYDHPDGDTLLEAPTAFVAADGSGTLSLTIGADATIGTLGLTYDASNISAGTVRFSNLTVGYTTVLFLEPVPPCEWDAELAADDDKCVEPEPTPTASPTTEPAAGQGGSDDESGLPVTGVQTGLLAAGGVAAAGLGTGLLLALRRRRITFTTG